MHNIFQSDAVKLLVAQVSTQEAFVAYMSLGLDHWDLYDMLGICDMVGCLSITKKQKVSWEIPWDSIENPWQILPLARTPDPNPREPAWEVSWSFETLYTTRQKVFDITTAKTPCSPRNILICKCMQVDFWLSIQQYIYGAAANVVLWLCKSASSHKLPVFFGISIKSWSLMVLKRVPGTVSPFRFILQSKSSSVFRH